ncbi:hypothetical protein OC846_004023 [Tilletia horrida]|uniref:Dickkopf N-terminal cysteine-rich domain-containing protein n=1 Tax=Tilletia horrida TaxID=155126 RepID=A0AAN6GNZ0_9BASI|nr:hypothetical protein OC846_004023 [Tilletia horrida]KAK0567177.1 hypothetical protein OC861_002863 [Tilletia horrida]
MLARSGAAAAAALLMLGSLLPATHLVQAQSDPASCPPSDPDILGKPCSTANNRLALDTNQFLSDCGYTAYCDPNTSTCVKNGCRRDEYPFGFKRKCDWPPLCESGYVCPDEGSGCVPTRRVGSPCQLNRDDECAPTASGRQTMCLHNVCQAVNATAGAACITDNVIYTVYTSASTSYGDIISRDNCVSGYYCDGVSRTCQAAKNVGSPCSGNKECRSYNCVDSGQSVDIPLNNSPLGRCGQAPSVPNRPGVWIYVVITLVIILGSFGLCCGLVQVHARGRRARRKERRRYFEKQALLREEVYEAYFQAAAKGDGSMHLTEAEDAALLARMPHASFHRGAHPDSFGSISGQSQRSSAITDNHIVEPLTHRGDRKGEFEVMTP